MPASPIGLHRVREPAGVLPQAAERLDARPEIWPDEVRVRLERLNIDAASFRQLLEAHDGDGNAVRNAVCEIINTRGKLHNPVTGSGGMLIGTVEEVGPASTHGLRPGQRIATLVSLTLTPLAVTDKLRHWDGRSEQVPAEGHAILFARSTAALLPEDVPTPLALAVLDVCGAPALTTRVVNDYLAGRAGGRGPRRPLVAVIGASGKSGSLSLAAARTAGARTIGVVPFDTEAEALRDAGLAHHVALADARNPIALAAAVDAAGGPADITVVCVDVPGCEGGAILATAQKGTIVFFSMATSFPAAALGAEGLAADITMIVGNGYVPGHAAQALDLIRNEPGVRWLYETRLAGPER
jgi:L-erythro-3,5-diaminohexanoate dehydrogenase